jgi:hypothetical protein
MPDISSILYRVLRKYTENVDVQDVIDVDSSVTAYGHEMNVVKKNIQVLENEIADLVHPSQSSTSLVSFLLYHVVSHRYCRSWSEQCTKKRYKS